MAGHSKFKNIMHRKGAQDAKRAKIFARIAREITISAKLGENSPRLRAALALARSHNMPKDNIKKALEKASSAADHNDHLEEITYEGYGPAGVAVIVEALTDNRNRTASEVRSTFTKFGGNLGESGSVSFLFDHVGLIQYAPLPEEEAFTLGVENGAEDVWQDEHATQFIVPIPEFHNLCEVCINKFGDPEDQRIAWIPKNTIAVQGDDEEKLKKLLARLEDIDDVQEVFANAEYSS